MDFNDVGIIREKFNIYYPLMVGHGSSFNALEAAMTSKSCGCKDCAWPPYLFTMNLLISPCMSEMVLMGWSDKSATTNEYR